MKKTEKSQPVEPRQARGAERVEKLLDAATGLIAADGVDGFAFRAVAKRAGTAQGSLYQFFPSRDALLNALHRRFSERIVSIAEKIESDLSEAQGSPGISALAKQIVKGYGPFLAENPAYLEVRRWSSHSDASILEDQLDDALASVLAKALLRVKAGMTIAQANEMAFVIIEIADALLAHSPNDPRWSEAAYLAIAGYIREAMDASNKNASE